MEFIIVKAKESIIYAKKIWAHMNDRCSANYVRKEKPSYLHCVNNFESVDFFVEWCHNSPGFLQIHNNRKWGLDKDLLIQGNKTYSPETCCFAPEFINNIFLIRNRDRGDYPCGVTKTWKSSTFIARCCTLDSRLKFSGFKTPMEAHMKWVEIKAIHTLQAIDRYKTLQESREDVISAMLLRYDQLIEALEHETEITLL